MARLPLLVLLALLLAAATAAPGGAAAQPEQLRVAYVPAHPRNYAHAHRPASMVRLIVVHSIEGSYWGAISWFRNPRARVSSHYVVAQRGAVTQMVSERRAAWHAGNASVNRRSIGIEHEGYAYLIGTFTDAEYRASARLAASVMRRYVLPIDRSRVIAHAEVRDPYRPWRLGGYGHHTDPGPHWDWSRYMAYIRSYAAGRTPPPRPFDVTVPGLAIGQTVRGVVRWEAVPLGVPPARVEFIVDGRVRDTQRQPPYVFGGPARTGWDTTRESNGRHKLRVRATAVDGRTADASVVVTVSNPRKPPRSAPATEPLKFVSWTPLDGDTLWGPVRWEVLVEGTPQRVEFLVDGVLRDTQVRSPYVFGGPTGIWDTTRETPGPHKLTVRAVGARTAAELTVDVIVAPPPR